MKTTHSRSRMWACALALTAAPLALADADKKFQKMDANNDGKISREEHVAGARQMFAETDTNNDGIITVTEMERKLYAERGQGQGDAKQMSARDKVRTVDQNSDGRLTRGEHARGAEQMFAKMDRDQDGFLTREELAAGHREMEGQGNS